MEAQRFRELVPEPVQGRQRGHGVLEDHADLAAPDSAQFRYGQAQQVPALEERRAGVYAGRGHGQESDQALGGDRFSAAGFADEPEHFAGSDVERDAVGGPDAAGVGIEGHGQVL